MGYGRVLDVACKDGKVTRDFLVDKFEVVDMFDIDPIEIKKSKELKPQHKNIRNIDCISMQEYKWKEKYNCIFIRWGIGYLKGRELLKLL